jgi:hypothetical protein
MNRQELWESVMKWLFASENTVALLSISRMSIFSEFQQVELQYFGPSRIPPPLRCEETATQDTNVYRPADEAGRETMKLQGSCE